VTGKNYAVVHVNELLRTDADYLALELGQLKLVRKMAPVVVVFDDTSEKAQSIKDIPAYEEDKFESTSPDKQVDMDRLDIRRKEQRLQTQ
jgi:hypothetical protein